MEKIEFFRPRCIEHDGSISVGFWMCVNKKVEDGYFYRASDVDALRAAVKTLVEAGKNLAIKSAENKGDITAEDFGKLWKAIAAVERLHGGLNGQEKRRD